MADEPKSTSLIADYPDGRYVLAVNPRALPRGVHRVLARTTFKKNSATKARTLRVTFSRCARIATSPAFTG